ncbi:hypothetical protein [Pantoea agglomerans]|uniref:hypothetical protein n=1 Tax=Enterobacter agglomerans TaxID=549 RepID=UPI00103C346F|nr:hypothetical protein [Pantoea agglomerans]
MAEKFKDNISVLPLPNMGNRYGGEPPNGGDSMLEKRVEKLEQDLSAMKVDLAIIKSNYSTSSDVASVKVEIANAKADLHSALRLQAITIVGSVLAAVGIGVGIIIRLMPH